MSDLLKAALDELKRAFEEFKALNDRRLAEISAKGTASADTTAAVERANTQITELSAKVESHQAKIREMETAAARVLPAAGTHEAAERERGHARAFFSRVRKQPINEVQVADSDVETYRNYRSGFFSFMRGGESISPQIKAALNVGTDTQGGLWVPPDTTGRIIELVRESSPIRQLADVQSISVDALEGYNDLNEADAGWVGETAARAETNTPDLGAWRIPLMEQYAAPRTTQKILDTSVQDVEGWLSRKVADKIARVENTAYVLGTGIKQPRGFTTYVAGTPSASVWNVIEQVLTSVSGGFHATTPGDVFINTVGSLKERYRANAKWLMARLTVAAVRKLKDGQGNYLWMPDFQDGGMGAIQGHPIVVAEDMAAIGANSLSIAFGDFKEGYQIIDHTTGLRMLRDPFTAKPWVIFYTTKYTGGDVVNFEALKIIKFA